jgi:hypothetical protein
MSLAAAESGYPAALATRHQREQQQTPAPVLPERHGPRQNSETELGAVAAAFNSRPSKALGWRTRQKPSTNCYARFKKAVLRRALEPGQYLSIRYTESLNEAGIETSVGNRGDAYDDAMAKSVVVPTRPRSFATKGLGRASTQAG